MRPRTVLAVAFAALSLLAGPSAAEVAQAPHAADGPASPGVDVLAVQSMPDHEISLVAAVHPMPLVPLDRTAVTASAGTTKLPTAVEPVLSGRTALGLVLDASAAGAAALRDGGRSGAAGFLLQLPPGARTTVVADRRPAVVASKATVGVSQGLAAASGLRSSGDRATTEALTLTLRELPPWPASQPVIVLYTSAPNAGGESPTALGERLQRAHAILTVVSTDPDARFWSSATSLTGGFAVSTRPEQAIRAFDRVADDLRARYVVTFPRPSSAATQAWVQINAAGHRLVVAVPLPGPETSPDHGPTRGWWVPAWAGGVLLVAAAGVGAVALRRRRATHRPATPPSATVASEATPPGEEVGSTPEPAGAPFMTSVSSASPSVTRAVRQSVPPAHLIRDARLVPAEERVLAHKERSWAARMPDVDPSLLRWTAAAATIAGADTQDDARALLAALPALQDDSVRSLRERLIRWWSGVVPGPRLLNPLRPDRLGEHLAARALVSIGDGADDVLDRLLQLNSDRQVGATLDLLGRGHAGQPVLAHLGEEALLRNFADLAHRVVRESGRVTGRPADATIADAVVRVLSPSLVQRLTLSGVSPDQPDRNSTVSVACTQLSALANASGRQDEARALLDLALQVDQSLAAGTPEALEYRRRVAADHGRLARLDATAGRVSMAETGYRRALDTLRELVELDPAHPADRRDLAIVHTRLADLDRDGRLMALADAGYRRALEALQDLVQLDPDNLTHRRDLAAAYVRLADLDADAGWVAQAEAGYRRAREINVESERLRAGSSDRRTGEGEPG